MLGQYCNIIITYAIFEFAIIAIINIVNIAYPNIEVNMLILLTSSINATIKNLYGETHVITMVLTIITSNATSKQ